MDTRGVRAQLHMCLMLRACWALVLVVPFAAGVPVRQKVLPTPRWPPPASIRLAHLKPFLDSHEGFALGAPSGDGPTDEWESPFHHNPQSSSDTYATRSPLPEELTSSSDPFPTVIDTAVDSSDEFSDELLSRSSSPFEGPSSLLNTFVFRPSAVGEVISPTTDSEEARKELGTSWSNRLALSDDLSNVHAIITAISATHIYREDPWTVSTLHPSSLGYSDFESRHIETFKLPSISSVLSTFDESYFHTFSTKWFYQDASNAISDTPASDTAESKFSDASTTSEQSSMRASFLPWGSFLTSVHADVSESSNTFGTPESSISNFLLFNGSSTFFPYQSFFYSTVESTVTIIDKKDTPFTYIIPTFTVIGTSNIESTLFVDSGNEDLYTTKHFLSPKRALETTVQQELTKTLDNDIYSQRTRMFRSEYISLDNETELEDTDYDYESEVYAKGRIVGQFTFSSTKPFLPTHQAKTDASSDNEILLSTSISHQNASTPPQSTGVISDELFDTRKLESERSSIFPSIIVEPPFQSDVHSVIKKDKSFYPTLYIDTSFLDPYTHHVTVRSLKDEQSIGVSEDSFQYASESFFDGTSGLFQDTFSSTPLSENVFKASSIEYPSITVHLMSSYPTEISFNPISKETTTLSLEDMPSTTSFLRETTVFTSKQTSFELPLQREDVSYKEANTVQLHSTYIDSPDIDSLTIQSITPKSFEESRHFTDETDKSEYPLDEFTDTSVLFNDSKIFRSYPITTTPVFGVYSSSLSESINSDDFEGPPTSKIYQKEIIGEITSSYNNFEKAGETVEPNGSTFVGMDSLESKILQQSPDHEITPAFSLKNYSSQILQPDVSQSISESARKSYFEFQDSTKITDYETQSVNFEELDSFSISSPEAINADLLTSNFSVLFTPVPSFFKTTILPSNEMTTQIRPDPFSISSFFINSKSTSPLSGNFNTTPLMNYSVSVVSSDIKSSFQPIDALDMSAVASDKTQYINECMLSSWCTTSSESYYSRFKEPRSMDLDSTSYYDSAYSETRSPSNVIKESSESYIIKEKTSLESFYNFLTPDYPLASSFLSKYTSVIPEEESKMPLHVSSFFKDSEHGSSTHFVKVTPLTSEPKSEMSNFETVHVYTNYPVVSSMEFSFGLPLLKPDSKHQMEDSYGSSVLPLTPHLINPDLLSSTSIRTSAQDSSSVKSFTSGPESSLLYSSSIALIPDLSHPYLSSPTDTISKDPLRIESDIFSLKNSISKTPMLPYPSGFIPTITPSPSQDLQSPQHGTFITPSVTNSETFLHSEIQLSTDYFKSKDASIESGSLKRPSSVESDTLNKNEPKSLESDIHKSKDPKSIESDVFKSKDPKSIESDVFKSKDPKSVESDFLKSKDPKSIESDILKPKDPKSLESDVLKPKDPKSIESDHMRPKDPKTVELDILKPKDPKSIDSDVLKPKEPKSIESDVLKPKDPKSVHSDDLKPHITSFSGPISTIYPSFMSMKPQFEYSSPPKPEIKPTRTETTKLQTPFPASMRPELSPTWEGPGEGKEETMVASVLPISSFLNMNETKNASKIVGADTKANESSNNQEQVIPTKNPLLFKDNHYWIETVLEAPLKGELPENFSHTMELRLANAYSEAFRLRAANNDDIKEAKSMVVVKILSLTDDILLRQLDLVYVVEKDGALVPANVASEYFSSLRFEQLREFLGHHVIIKARPYRPASEESRPVGSPLPVLAIVCGALGGLLLIFCCFCIYCRCCKSKYIPSSPESSTSGSLQRSLSKYGQHNRKHLFREMTHHLTTEMAAQMKSGSTAPDTYLAEKSSGRSLPTLPRDTDRGEKSMKILKILGNKDASTSPIPGKPPKSVNEGQESSGTSTSEKKKAPKPKKRRKIKDSHEQSSKGAIPDPLCPEIVPASESPPPTPPPKGDVSTLEKRRSSDSGTSSRHPESQPSSSSDKGTEETESEGSNVELLPPLKDMMDKSKSDSDATAAETEKHLSRVRQRISELLDDAFALAGGRRLYGSLRSKKIEPTMEILPRFGSLRSQSAMGGQYAFKKHQGGIYLERRPISEGGQRLLGVITDEGHLITHPSPKLVWEQDEMSQHGAALEVDRPLSEVIEACNQNLSFVPFHPQRVRELPSLPSSSSLPVLDTEDTPCPSVSLLREAASEVYLPHSSGIHPAAADQYDEIDVVSALRNGEPVEALIQAIKEELQKFSSSLPSDSESHA